MIHAIWQTIQRVFKDLFAAGGLLASAIGAVSDLLGKTFILPSWVWWALGVILLVVTASRLQWDLQKEKDKNRKPTPQIPLSQVIVHMIGTDDQSKPGASTSVGKAFSKRHRCPRALEGNDFIFGAIAGAEWKNCTPRGESGAVGTAAI